MPTEEDTRLCALVGEVGFCSGACVLGTPFGCEPYGTEAFCLLPVDDTFGLCLERCDVPADCAQAGYDCVPLGALINDRTGACLPAPVPAAAPAS